MPVRRRARPARAARDRQDLRRKRADQGARRRRGRAIPALADDSGLCVAALDGRPGVYTADWAERQWFEGPSGRDWYMAMGKVEGMLCELGPECRPQRPFRLRSRDCLARRRERGLRRPGRGALTWPPRGTMGFGYDPVFVPQGDNAALSPKSIRTKNTASATAPMLSQAGRGPVRRRIKYLRAPAAP